jgi:oligopeptide/dipeptide ABC transporter ATP-binding protein
MTSLNPVQRVGGQIAEVLRLHRGMKEKEARTRAIELLRLVGIPNADERVDAYPHHLSGGQRQRVMIAMALACEPDLLIADEPTTALDVTIQAQILDLLAELRGRLGMAVILITHDLGVVAEVCDRVVVMYAGQVVEQGSVAQIFTDPRHPYTEGLLRAVPRLGQKLDKLAVIPGTVPSPIGWPVGCRFHTRCPYGWDLCVREQPPLLPVRGEEARVARCWLEEHPARRAEIRARGVYTDGKAPLEAPAEQYHRVMAAHGEAPPPEGARLEDASESLLPEPEREDLATRREPRGEVRRENER